MDVLQPFLLDGVSVVKGENSESHSGAYGFVYEVEFKGVIHIAKKPHIVFLSKKILEQEKLLVISKFREECFLLSQLRHPNIVQFVGVYYGPGGRDDAALVMEKLDCDLSAFLENNRGIDQLTKLMILQDVSYGLVYLHEYNPLIIHRDLTARNILLTQSRQAKIADVGVAKLMDEKAKQADYHTQAPGQMYYMPPEACRKNADYSSELDIFSFGHLSLHTILEEYPVVYEVDLTPEMLQEGSVQVMKRQTSLSKIGTHHCLYQSIVKCLMDNPKKRPTARQMNNELNLLVLGRRQQGESTSLKENENRALTKLLVEKNLELEEIKKILQQEVEYNRECITTACYYEESLGKTRQTLNSQTEELTEVKMLLASMEKQIKEPNDEILLHQTTDPPGYLKAMPLLSDPVKCAELKDEGRSKRGSTLPRATAKLDIYGHTILAKSQLSKAKGSTDSSEEELKCPGCSLKWQGPKRLLWKHIENCTK